MIRTTKLMTLCAFVFGMSFATTAFAACNGVCFSQCQTRAIDRCLAAGGGEECYWDSTYYQCYRQCGCIIP